MPPEFPSGTTDITQLIQDIKETFQFLISPQFQEKLFALKIVFIAISILFFLAILYFLFKSSYLRESYLENLENLYTYRGFGQRRIVRKWKKIKKKLKGSEAQQKLSLIEALQMFDKTLVRMGYGGKNLEERLKKLTEDDVSNLSQVLEAHQVCQDIARDPDYKLSKEKAEEILNIFERALKELQIF